jgi:hypothetical protein
MNVHDQVAFLVLRPPISPDARWVKGADEDSMEFQSSCTLLCTGSRLHSLGCLRFFLAGILRLRGLLLLHRCASVGVPASKCCVEFANFSAHWSEHYVVKLC